MPDDVTSDRLLGGRVILRQPRHGYRVAVDPVLLAAAVQAAPGAHVLDAGCGTGAAMFCLAARCADLRLTGLEVDDARTALARAGVALNGWDARMTVLDGDVSAPPPACIGAFDVVLTNPPFAAEGTPSPDAGRATAHHESGLDLAAWVRACLACLRPKGRLVMIHRADRLAAVLAALNGKAGDIRILPVYPRRGEAARRVIVDAGKGRRSPDTLLPGLVLHDADGRFTPAADRILRDAASLSEACQ
jgi:tRNA1(Val) A37 N6-methylase TrmN6